MLPPKYRPTRIATLLIALVLNLCAPLAADDTKETAMPDTAPKWTLDTLDDLLARHAENGQRYLEFLRVPALNAGIYALPAGGEDPQPVHDEDEVYYILAGKAVFWVDGAERPAQAGDVIYVAAGVEHRFHSIEEDLKVLVVFSSAKAD